MSNQISFNNAMKEVTGNNFVTLDQLKNDNEIYFPLFKNNVDGTGAKKILGKLIANNSGGGSTPSAYPDRVIIIDTTLTENIEGKAYSTFAAAKTYMEANPSLKFCVELPAGDFGTTANDKVTLSDQWEIHGNNTKLIFYLDSKLTMGQDFIVIPSGIYITGCTIAAGFKGIYATTEEEMADLPVYKLHNCRITEFTGVTGDTEDQYIVSGIFCEVNTTRSYDNLNPKGTAGSHPLWVLFCHSQIYQLADRADTSVVCTNSEIGDVGAYSAKFINCTILPENAEAVANFNVPVLEFNNTAWLIVRNHCEEMQTLELERSHISMHGKNLGPEIIRNIRCADASTLTTYSEVTITSDDVFVSPDSRLDVNTGSSVTGVANHFMDYIMYSTDGGQTMSTDKTSATHYGILRQLPIGYEYSTSLYEWFPMPN